MDEESTRVYYPGTSASLLTPSSAVFCNMHVWIKIQAMFKHAFDGSVWVHKMIEWFPSGFIFGTYNHLSRNFDLFQVIRCYRRDYTFCSRPVGNFTTYACWGISLTRLLGFQFNALEWETATTACAGICERRAGRTAFVTNRCRILNNSVSRTRLFPKLSSWYSDLSVTLCSPLLDLRTCRAVIGILSLRAYHSGL